LKQPREIYYEPKIETENTDALHIDDIRLDEPDAGADAAQENDASKRPSFSRRFVNMFRKSKKVHPRGGNSRKSRKSRKTKSRKSRKSKQRKRKSNSRI